MLRTTLVGFAFVLASCQMPLRSAELPKCLKLDGTEEPCESRHTRPVILVIDDSGGPLIDYVDRWQKVSIAGHEVEVLGFCDSACTTVVAFVPKDKLCFGKNASLKFHQARVSMYGSASPEMTKWMFDQYPPDIRGWIVTHGDYEKIPDKGFWTLTASDLWKMGYRRCTD
jgi:hypothetical protein